MRTVLAWILLILMAVGGITGSYALSEKFRTDARQVWQKDASQAARWLSGTVLRSEGELCTLVRPGDPF